MPPTLILVAIAAAAMLFGLAIGLVIGLRKHSNRNEVVELEERLEQALARRAEYEAEVSEHFAQTSELLKKLTRDYQSVYSHLARGADLLGDGTVKIAPIASTSETDDAEIPSNMVEIMQPLDYAPRDDGQADGQLSESFGLERSKLEMNGFGAAEKTDRG